MIIGLPYGRGELPVRLADECEVTVVRKPEMPVIADPGAAVVRALGEPVAAPPLADLAAGRKSACILICDVTRPVPNALFLKALIREIVRAGIPQEQITVLVATGLHRPNEGDELRQVVGDDWVMDNVRIENHFARDDSAHVDLGTTDTRGTPVKLDRRFVEADLRIATGLVEPHIMAGYSGGCKVIAPGIAHQDTIRTFHSARFLEDPAAVQCNLAGNPLREEQLEIVRMLGEVHAVNTVIDERRRLSFVNFGEIVESHLAAVDFAHGFCRVSLPRRFKTVVTSAAGYPLDQTYYQTVKSMLTPMGILDQRCNADRGCRLFRGDRVGCLPRGPAAPPGAESGTLPERFASLSASPKLMSGKQRCSSRPSVRRESSSSASSMRPIVPAPGWRLSIASIQR